MQNSGGANLSGGEGGGGADGVVCEFVRQRCTHDALFLPFYKRSNRTKGSKILRCFPHCCPNHAHRGFCGSSLHVRVQWSTLPADRSAAPPPPAIHVFGRFRLTDTPPLAIGHRLAANEVFSAVQSDDTPNGEWIESQMIYSWSETNWLFEINSAARWFYGWESSTVKSQRLKDHVLDVYVMAATASSTSTDPYGHSASPSSSTLDMLQVVATTTSPPFQLISFRRATDDAMLALSATHHMRQQLHSGSRSGGADTVHTIVDDDSSVPHVHTVMSHPTSHSVHHHQALVPMVRREHPPPTTMMALPSLRPSSFVAAATTTAFQPQQVARPQVWTAPPLATTSMGMAFHRPQLDTSRAVFASTTTTNQPLPSTSEPHVGWRPQPHPQFHPQPQQSFSVPRALSTGGGGGGSGSGADKNMWELINVVGQLRQIPLVDALERVAWMQETYDHYVATYTAAATGKALDTKKLYPLVDAELHVRRALSTLDAAVPLSTHRKISSRLLATLTEVGLWLLFDPDIRTQSSGALATAASTLLDPLMVRRHFGRFFFWLHDHVQRFLHVRFNRTIRELLLECQESGFQIQYDSGRAAATVTQAFPSRAGSLSLPKMKGMDTFVAQIRQMHVATQIAASTTRRTRAPVGGRRPLPPAPAIHTEMRRQFSAQWRCPLDRISVRRPQRQPSTPSTQSSDLTVFSLVWFWRQFSVVGLNLHASEPQLDVQSLFHLPPLGSQFLLDGKDRFFQAFPAGEATLGVPVGHYLFGDYVGQYSPAVGEVQLSLYSFLSPTQLASGSSSSSSSFSGQEEEHDHDLPVEQIAFDACFCYHVRLIVTPASTLVANVTVKRGELDVAALRRVGYASARLLLQEMAMWTLQEKLTAVRAFEDLYHVDLVYSHCNTNTSTAGS